MDAKRLDDRLPRLHAVIPTLIAVAVFVLAGCGDADEVAERAVEEASGGEVKLERKGDETKIEVGGEELENKQGGLVDGFPKDFPLPDDFEISTSTKTQGKYQAFGAIPSGKKALAFFKAELPKKDWKIEVARADASGTFQVIASKGARQAVVNSGPANEGANLTVVVE